MTLSPTDWVRYGLLALVAFIVVKRIWTALNAKRKIPTLLDQGAVVVDVRSQREFSAGNAAGSRNIPLNELEQGAKNLDPKRWIIVCCASGARSAMARRWLLRNGFPLVLNAGSWRNLP
jgi:phage shock protein E